MWSNLRGKLGSCVTQRRRSIHCTYRYCENILLHPVFRSLSTCGAPHHWWWMGRRPSTHCQNPICLSTSSTVRGCAMRQRRFDSVCSKVLWHSAYLSTIILSDLWMLRPPVTCFTYTRHGVASETLNSQWPFLYVHADFTVCCMSSYISMIYPCRTEGERSYVPRRLSAAGWVRRRGPQADGGGVQPGQPVNHWDTFPCCEEHIHGSE